MSERQKLMELAQMYDFALTEIKLYLDTHPGCKQALEYYHKYSELRNSAYNEYAKLYGPIIPQQNVSKNWWNWIDSPWPWERSAN